MAQARVRWVCRGNLEVVLYADGYAVRCHSWFDSWRRFCVEGPISRISDEGTFHGLPLCSLPVWSAHSAETESYGRVIRAVRVLVIVLVPAMAFL